MHSTVGHFTSKFIINVSIKAKVETIWFSPGVLAQDSTTANCPSANILITARVKVS